MPSTAILVGNTQYRNLGSLACCRDDIAAMKELLLATEKYSDIHTVETRAPMTSRRGFAKSSMDRRPPLNYSSISPAMDFSKKERFIFAR